MMFVFIQIFPKSAFTMATPKDKFDNTKPLSVEEMNKTAFQRWMAEAHNEVSILLVECLFTNFMFEGQ